MLIESISVSHWLLAFVIVLFAAFVQTTIGFGLAIIAAPLLFSLSPLFVPVPVMLATIANTFYTSLTLRQHWSLTLLWPALLARIPGGLLGVWLLVNTDATFLALLIAAIISLGIVANIVQINLPVNRWTLSIAGFITGIAGTATSIGGPPMAILLQGKAPTIIRSQLAAFFMLGALMSVVMLLPTDELTKTHWLIGAGLLPAVLLGSWCGQRWGYRVPAAWLRIGTVILSGLAVLVMLYRYFVH